MSAATLDAIRAKRAALESADLDQETRQHLENQLACLVGSLPPVLPELAPAPAAPASPVSPPSPSPRPAASRRPALRKRP